MSICFFYLLCKPSLKVFSNFFTPVNQGIKKNIFLIRDIVSSVAAAATRSFHRAAD